MTRRAVDILPQAVAEGREARDYYQSKSALVEETFRKEIDRGIEMIREHPETWPHHLHGTRRFIFNRFPYTLVYATRGSYSLLVAIAHSKRNPGHWKSRLPQEVSGGR